MAQPQRKLMLPKQATSRTGFEAGGLAAAGFAGCHSATVAPALGLGLGVATPVSRLDATPASVGLSPAGGLGGAGLSPMAGLGDVGSLDGGAGGLGLSVNVGALPDEDLESTHLRLSDGASKDGLAALSPDGRLAELRRKRDQLASHARVRPDDVRSLWRLARVHLELREVPEFTEFAAELCRRHRDAWRNVCRVLRKLDRPHEALRVLTEVEREQPGNAEVCCAIAKLVEPARARGWYEKALEREPLCAEALLAVADERRKADGNFAEAARLYEAALQQRPAVKLLYRLGECLVQDGRGAEGRHYLMQVLSNEDRTFDMHAAVMIALSYTMTQQHSKALEFCQRAEELHAAATARGGGNRLLMKHAWICKGITQLNSGQRDLALETLRSAAREAAPTDAGNSRWADEMIECTLGLVETQRGNMAAAERHLEQARRLGVGPPPGPDVLVNTAYLRQVQGNFQAAQSLLSQCLDNFPDNAMALLRMGYVLLCQGQLDHAVQFLQKCLQQPSGTLTYGESQKGAAHLYLCAALHLRAAERGQPGASGAGGSAPARGDEEAAAREQFRNGYELLPHFPRGLADLVGSLAPKGGAGAALAGASPGGPGRPLPGAAPANAASPAASPSTALRLGALDLTLQQANVLLLHAERRGLVHAAAVPAAASPHAGLPVRAPHAAPRASFAGQAPGEATASPISTQSRRLPVCGSPFGAQAVTPKAAALTPDAAATPGGLSALVGGGRPGLGCGAAGAAPPCLEGYPPPTLVGTASTAAPTSCGPSRDASDRDLHRESGQQPCATGAPGASWTGDEGSAGGGAAALELRARLPPEKLLRFSDLELADCISHGEFAIVHRGVLRESRLDVVVKTLHQKDCVYDEQAAAELRAEVAIIAELSHPRLVTFVGACLESSQVALVTELAPGGNLHQALHVRRRQLSREERFQLATELLEGVRYLHARSPPVAHLDLKSMNLVLDEDGQHLQICDFGLSRALGQAPGGEGDRPLSRGGSPRYMSPECYDSNLGTLTEKADVWSSGCILIEIFGGTLPYAECSNVQQILKLMLVHHCGPSIPTSIEASVRTVIGCTLAFEAQERLAIAQVLLRLQAIGSSGSGGENKSRFMWIP